MDAHIIFDNDRIISGWLMKEEAEVEIERLKAEAEEECKRNGQHNGHYFHIHTVTCK